MKFKKLVLILVVLLGFTASQYAQKMSRTETMTLYYSTTALDKECLEHLIQFVLTKDVAEYTSASKILKTQLDNSNKLKNNGTGDWELMFSIDAAVNIYDSMIAIYGDYFRDQIIRDETKTSDFEYMGKTYQLSKMRKKEFKDLAEELKKLEKK
ncbi:MAG: hypothetical protein IPH88_18705 [Bacteroidales bacterium]|nr:hypothetical protein [Bacteroidales bacterium]